MIFGRGISECAYASHLVSPLVSLLDPRKLSSPSPFLMLFDKCENNEKMSNSVGKCARGRWLSRKNSCRSDNQIGLTKEDAKRKFEEKKKVFHVDEENYFATFTDVVFKLRIPLNIFNMQKL